MTLFLLRLHITQYDIIHIPLQLRLIYFLTHNMTETNAFVVWKGHGCIHCRNMATLPLRYLKKSPQPFINR